MQPKFIPDRFRDTLLLLFSILGVAILTGRGIYLVITVFTPVNLAFTNDLTSSLMDAFGMFFCAALLVPLFIYYIRKRKGMEIRQTNIPAIKFWQMVAIIGVWVLILFLGSILNGLPNFARILALPFFLVGIAMPIAGLIWMAIGGLKIGSWRRVWATFGIGMAGSSLGAILMEYSIVGIAVLAAGMVAATNPEWLATFQRIKHQVTSAGDVQSLLTTLAPYLTNPVVLLLALIFAAVLAPVIEETLKPAAVWLLGRRLQSPAEGFALGALCGAGFALFEGTLAASGSPQMLEIGIVARAASSLMHITASGLMGWGIASARLEKHYGRLAGAYVLSVSIHGLWNGSVILAVFGGLRLTLPGALSDPLSMLIVLAGIGILGSLLVTIIVLLPILNHHLQVIYPVAGIPVQNGIIAPPKI